jgi:hypothetical protein
MIYCPLNVRNVTAVARIIRKLGFFPLSGTGSGRRQPVHAEELAIAAADAIDSNAAERPRHSPLPSRSRSEWWRW